MTEPNPIQTVKNDSSPMVTKQQVKSVIKKKGVNHAAQLIFKYCAYFLVLTLVYFIPGFIRFRQYIQAKGYYVFSTEGTYMIIIGFFSIFITRYGYYKLARSYIGRFVKPTYKGQERQIKIDTFLKLSFDFAFYLCVTLYFIYEFRKQYWFPTSLGGQGCCDSMYKQYPDWPLVKRSSLQDYFCYQLGVHLFSVFQIFAIRRQKQRKFYQYTLHHVVATVLILFSMTLNEIVAGGMILAVHDGSDIAAASARLYFQAQLPKWIKNKYITAFMGIYLVSCWIYFRLIIFPFCILRQVYNNIPTQKDSWFMIKNQYVYLLGLAGILVMMHIYWLFYIAKSVLALAKKSQNVNVYDTPKHE